MLRWEAEHYDRIWEQNELRLRSLNLERGRQPGVTRILVLGDSFSWGDKIARTRDTWPYVLESQLRRDGHRVEVVSLAKGGFTTVNHGERLDAMGWEFEPDLVLLQSYLNDPLPSGPGYRREGERWLYRLWPLLPGLHDRLDRASYLYSFLNARFAVLQGRVRELQDYHALYRDDFEGWLAAQKALAGMASAASERGVPLLGVLFPSFSVASLHEAAYPYVGVHEKIARVHDELEIPLLDLREALAQRDPKGVAWWALPCDAHPSQEAHALAGAVLAEWLPELGVLARPLSAWRSGPTRAKGKQRFALATSLEAGGQDERTALSETRCGS
ncbi:MAG: SGNH/GDSL hydrolase family protein [Myxococcota bacterium]|nr:SGNH/GDSL hydrolase family protein [Myxococcota bacterium]